MIDRWTLGAIVYRLSCGHTFLTSLKLRQVHNTTRCPICLQQSFIIQKQYDLEQA